MKVNDIREHFKNELKNENFTVDKTGAKTIELIGASFIADEPAIFGTVNEDYVQKELAWYDSQSTNINDIYGEERDPPQAWKYSANEHGEINSNYGYLILSDKYHNQYGQVIDELLSAPDGRRASMIYQRPQIWVEFDDQNKNDFICTNAVTYYIRDNKLHAVVQMRSNDVIFGYKNDYAWQKHIFDTLIKDLNALYRATDWPTGTELTAGNIHWQVQNLHVYDRHFDLVK